MRMFGLKKLRDSLIAVIIILCTVNTGKATNNPNYSTREGSIITYYWLYTFDGNSTEMSFSICFNRGWQYMQDVYKSQNHSHGNYYTQFVGKDPFKEDVPVLVNVLRKIALQYAYNEAKVALSFVQSLPYDSEIGSYQRYAIECLIDRQGDCSDKSVLLMAILNHLGYQTVELHFPNHLAVGVKEYPSKAFYYGSYYKYGGDNFYFAESTCVGCEIGNAGDHVNESATVVPKFNSNNSNSSVIVFTCRKCFGRGYYGKEQMYCNDCNGTGRY
jgi:hypothetical protein